jgi:hypothetical protein
MMGGWMDPSKSDTGGPWPVSGPCACYLFAVLTLSGASARDRAGQRKVRSGVGGRPFAGAAVASVTRLHDLSPRFSPSSVILLLLLSLSSESCRCAGAGPR